MTNVNLAILLLLLALSSALWLFPIGQRTAMLIRIALCIPIVAMVFVDVPAPVDPDVVSLVEVAAVCLFLALTIAEGFRSTGSAEDRS